MKAIIEKYNAPMSSKLDNFEKYIRRQSMSRFMARYELFKMQLGVKGSVIECGVHHGGGLMAWAKLSAALEPYALDRRIIGFDTFDGFPSVDDKDAQGATENDESRVGGFHTGYDTHAELGELIAEFDANRFLNQYQKVFMVKGDANVTIPTYVQENPFLLISLLFLDFDLYTPTKTALQHFLPRMPKGSILAFDEVNNQLWPGETVALLEELDLNSKTLNRFTFDPNISYIVM